MAQGSVALQMTLSRILASVVISFVFLAKNPHIFPPSHIPNLLSAKDDEDDRHGKYPY